MQQLNLQHPMQARRWLRLLVEDPDCGFRIRRGISVPARDLGFTFRANHLGLHGPANERSPNVIFGTSFAQGMAVNEGQNWFDYYLASAEWLNLGLPVGIQQWAVLRQLHHQAHHGTAVLLYHPNIWIHCDLYERWRQSGKGVFTALRWKTSLPACLWITCKRILRRPNALRRGVLQVVNYQGVNYEIDARYARINNACLDDLLDRNLECLRALLEPFRRVIVARIPVKLELVDDTTRGSEIAQTRKQFDEAWERTKQAVGRVPSAEIWEPKIFRLDHFHPRDTHWNAAGNRVFAEWLRQHLT